jgi:hypothetical protein
MASVITIPLIAAFFGRFFGPESDCGLFLPYGISLMDNI